jgi:DNA-binding transcriptional MocR family regulator
MPAATRRRLVQLARDHDLLIVSDDVYELLQHKHDPSRPHRLAWYDRHELDHGGMHVLGNSTFSKILGPGVRVGWIESHPALIERLSNSATVSSSAPVRS